MHARTLMLSFTAAALLVAAGAAQAGPPPSPPTVSVAYADLDLANRSDAALMLKRIRHAAADVCTRGPAFVGNDADTIRRIDDCFRQSVARAVAGLNAPLVSRAYAAKDADPVLARAR